MHDPIISPVNNTHYINVTYISRPWRWSINRDWLICLICISNTCRRNSCLAIEFGLIQKDLIKYHIKSSTANCIGSKCHHGHRYLHRCLGRRDCSRATLTFPRFMPLPTWKKWSICQARNASIAGTQ